jgi:arabinogalactan oligomer / maltooligosaccharide transport system substrate-binding protein
MSRTLKLAGLGAALALVVGVAPTMAQSPAAGAGLTGTVTLWDSYTSGAGTELDALKENIARVQAANPGLTITNQEVSFGDIFNKYQLEVASGGGPDLMVVPNDSLGQLTRDELTQALDDKIPAETWKDYAPLAVEGSKYEGKLVQVPESLKAVAMYYDPAKVANPPKTTDELLAAVKGGLKLGLVQGIYHDFGFAGAFGGKLMDEAGKCTADQGGFADALKYLADLKAAGATFDATYDNIAQGFNKGTFDAIIDGPWAAGGYVQNRPGVAVAAMPAGPKGPALPFTGVDGYIVNPNSQNMDLAVAVALALTDKDGQQIFANKSYHIPANATIVSSDPITKQFAGAVASGYPRPQSAKFGNFWGPFGDALNQVLDKGADPVAAVAAACAAMNKAKEALASPAQ